MARMRVFILTYCRNLDLLGGSTLVFKTLRTGFPTAEVHVADNCSLADARPVIQASADAAGCRFSQFNKEVAHHGFIEYVLSRYDGPIVFLDPDVIFWEPCEHWQFSSVAAGRLIPRFHDEYSDTKTAERLHTSFLWVPDAARLRSAVAETRRGHWDFQPFQPYSYRSHHGWVRFDCGAGLYAAMGDRCQPYDEGQLSAYDHLFLGSHLDLVLSSLPGDEAQVLSAVHAQAQSDPTSLKGLWLTQQAYFERRRCS